jgi:hypothetical protein
LDYGQVDVGLNRARRNRPKGSGISSVGSGTMQAFGPPLAPDSFLGTGPETPFSLHYQWDGGSGIRINGTARTGYQYGRGQAVDIEIQLPDDGVTLRDDGTHCIVTVALVTLEAIAGSYDCPKIPEVGGPTWISANGWFQAVDAPGIAMLTMSAESPFPVALPLTAHEAIVPGTPFHLSYGDGSGGGIEITGVATPGTYAGKDAFDLGFRLAQWGVAPIEDTQHLCTTTIDTVSDGAITGSLTCPQAVSPLFDGAMVATFTAEAPKS